VLCCRLLRSWSFQAKLGIVTNTLLRAAPQLGHLLLVILACLLLFALVACVGLGERVMPLSSAAGAVEEAFSVLLGLGTVGLADVFPAGVSLSAAEALLGLLIYYLRVVLFVMILSQYFMATLGAEFSRLKWLGRVLHARSIGADLAADMGPELRLRMQHCTQRMRGWQGRLARYSSSISCSVVPADTATQVASRHGIQDSCSVSSSKEALQLISTCMQQLNSSSSDAEQETSSGSAATLQVSGRQLDLSMLQQLLLQADADSKINKLQRQLLQPRTSADGDAAAEMTGDADSAAAAAAVAGGRQTDDMETTSSCDALAVEVAAAVAAQLLAALQGVPSSESLDELLQHFGEEVSLLH
jgi:hypothetical protein